MSIVDSLDRCCVRFDDIRACLRWAESALTTGSPAQIQASAELRASAFVAVCGAIEQFMREFADWIVTGVTDSGVTNRELTLSLHALAAADDFRSLQAIRDSERMFDRRILLLERTSESDACSLRLQPDELGLGGETVRPTHVATLWRIFRLPGSAFGDVTQEVALRVFADNRNDYAHGKVALQEFIENPECEVRRMLERIDALEAWCFHCWTSGEMYLSEKRYLR